MYFPIPPLLRKYARLAHLIYLKCACEHILYKLEAVI